MKKVANLARIKTDDFHWSNSQNVQLGLIVLKTDIFNVYEAFCPFSLRRYRTYYTYDRLCVCVCGRIVWASGTKKTSMIQRIPELQ